ncbi:Hypothetical predicted protein [Octopus vulgaris]|uniref:Uncharacterized protein n=1 Tax=Octopus vulgaris TaxID=6645 RepID=A0AA36AUJ0_OCTVU|nr:Hypothetical predicted protein [Octopus vulgaris]
MERRLYVMPYLTGNFNSDPKCGTKQLDVTRGKKLPYQIANMEPQLKSISGYLIGLNGKQLLMLPSTGVTENMTTLCPSSVLLCSFVVGNIKWMLFKYFDE